MKGISRACDQSPPHWSVAMRIIRQMKLENRATKSSERTAIQGQCSRERPVVRALDTTGKSCDVDNDPRCVVVVIAIRKRRRLAGARRGPSRLSADPDPPPLQTSDRRNV